MAHEPCWSMADLADNKKVTRTTLQSRYTNSADAPKPCLPAGGFGRPQIARGGKKKSTLYKRSELLAWFEAEDKRRPFKRNDAKEN